MRLQWEKRMDEREKELVATEASNSKNGVEKQ
jgi:hypothetical protein